MLWRLCLLLIPAVLLHAQSGKVEAQKHLENGVAAHARNDLETALEEFRQAAALDPDRAEIQARLGMAYRDRGMLSQSAAALERALKLDPNLPGVGLLLAFDYQELGRNQEAVPLLAGAVERETNTAVRVLAGIRLVDVYFASGDNERGLEMIGRLRKLAPDDPDVLYTASKAYASLWNNAVQQMIRVAPGSYRVHQVMAEVFEAQDRFADAAKEYRQILKMEPALPGAHYRLGRMILRMADTPEADQQALAEFQKELEISPGDVPTLVETGELHLRLQHSDEAAKYFARAIELRPSDARARVGLAKVQLARKEYAPAIGHLEQAARSSPSDENVRYQLMLAYRAAGRTADAQAAYREFQRIKSEEQRSQAAILNQLKGVPVERRTGP